MKTPDAKFLLRACRPDGRDSADPLFVEALAQARTDPLLQSWLAREQAVDAAIAARLATIAPPAGLRDAILVGARASRPRRVWWQNPLWLAAAACLAVTLSLFTLRSGSTAKPAASVANAFAALALHDLAADGADHLGHTPGLVWLEDRLADPAHPVTAVLAGFGITQLAPGGCREFSASGHQVFELCFARDGKMYHLYMASRADFPAAAGPTPVIDTQAALAAATWSDTNNIYAVVTAAGADALRNIL